MPAADTAPTKTTTPEPTPSAFGYVIDTAQKSGEQMLDFYLQAAKFTLDAGSAWMSTLPVLPILKPSSSGPAATAVKATADKLVSASFAVADHAIKVQKELSAQALALLEA